MTPLMEIATKTEMLNRKIAETTRRHFCGDLTVEETIEEMKVSLAKITEWESGQPLPFELDV